jgi:hypothetical protein
MGSLDLEMTGGNTIPLSLGWTKYIVFLIRILCVGLSADLLKPFRCQANGSLPPFL